MTKEKKRSPRFDDIIALSKKPPPRPAQVSPFAIAYDAEKARQQDLEKAPLPSPPHALPTVFIGSNAPRTSRPLAQPTPNSTVEVEPSSTIEASLSSTIEDHPASTSATDTAPSTIEDTPHSTVEDILPTTVDNTSTVECRTTSTVEGMTTSTVEGTTSLTQESPSFSTAKDRSLSKVEVGVFSSRLWMAENADGIFTTSRIRRIVNAQDALTHVEEAVYDVLWGVKKKAEHETHRLAQIGYSELAKKSRVSQRTIQSVIQRLIEKAFIQIERPADILRRQATVYRVLSYAAVLRNQRYTGRQWVVRTGKGIFYAKPAPSTLEDRPHSIVEVIPSSTVEVTSPPTVEGTSTSTEEATSTSTVEGTSTLKDIGTKGDIKAAAGSAAVHEAVARYLTIDDAAARRIVRECRASDSGATDDEIAHFAQVAAAQIAPQKRANNPTGLLIDKVRRFFPGAALEEYRRSKAQEKAKQALRIEQNKEAARKTLGDPDASEQEQAWAREVLGMV